MNAQLHVDGLTRLQSRTEELLGSVRNGKLVIRGLREGASIIAKAGRKFAPVRKRLSVRLLRKFTKRKGHNLTNATKRATKAYGRKDIPPGGLKKSIKFRVKATKTGGLSIAKAGMNVADKLANRKARHGHLVALGTKERKHKSGKKVGRMKPNPFFRDATNLAAPQAIRTLERRVLGDITRFTRGTPAEAMQ